MNDNEKSDLDSLWHARSETQREARARAEHLRVLSRHSIFALLGNVAGSLTLVVGSWVSVRQGLLIAWISVMMAFSFARWVTGRHLPDEGISEADTRRWEMRFITSVAISGVLWGAAGGLFYVQGQPEQSLFLALIIVSMCAAASASLSYHRFAYPVFLLPAISPVALQLMLDNKLALNAIGFVIPFYFTLLYLLSRAIYRTAHESILSRINSQYQAMFDHLTGLANRRAFEQAIDREWYRAVRDKRTLSLVIADIDNFKLCNDTRGHAAGDLLLKAVAALLERRIRRGADLVARIGGEEFAILLPDTDLNGAMALAQSIRVGLSELAESYNNQIPEVTMSYGVSSLVPDSSLDPDILLRQADEALYLAKGKGKDRVETIDTG